MNLRYWNNFIKFVIFIYDAHYVGDDDATAIVNIYEIWDERVLIIIKSKL